MKKKVRKIETAMPDKDNNSMLNLSIQEIYKLTPYLENNPDKDFKLTEKQRAFAWFYCANGFNGLDAAKRAGYGINPQGRGVNDKKQLAVTEEKQERSLSVITHSTLTNVSVKRAIRMILDEQISIIRNPLEKMICEVLMVKAFYDESMFTNPDGSPAFKKWTEIPKAYRCCVTGIEKRYFGKDCQRQVITIKLADKDKALDKLSEYIGMMTPREPLRIDVTSGGERIQPAIDLSNLSKDELNAFETLLTKVSKK